MTAGMLKISVMREGAASLTGQVLAVDGGFTTVTLLLWTYFAVDRVLYPRCQMQAWLPMRLWLTLTASSSWLAAAIALWR
jgi:hypothetical protein